MKRESLLFAAFIGISCSVSFIAGYVFHKETIPEIKSFSTALGFMSKESEIFKTFDQLALENFYYNQVSQVKSLEELAKVKGESKDRLLEEIAKLERLLSHEEKEYKVARNTAMLNEVEKIRLAITKNP